MIGKKRLALAAGSVTAAGAVATLVAGTTFGLFTSTAGPQTNAFTAGSVTLTSNDTVSGACTITNMLPGDASTGWASPGTDTPCTMTVSYAGSTAYEALDVLVASKVGTAASSTTALYDGSNSTGLNVSITDNQSGSVTYAVPTSASKTGSACPLSGQYTTAHGYTCYVMANEILASGGATVASNQFKVEYSLPASTGNGYQGGDAAVILTAHAVQQANNAITCSAVAPSAAFTPGSACTPTAGSWS